MTRFTQIRRKQLLLISAPLLVSNISAPLTGIIDTAIIGHLANVNYLAAIGIGSAIISMLYWLCGFLRMSTSGVTAQLNSQIDKRQRDSNFLASLLIALGIALILLCLSYPIIELSLWLSSASQQLTPFAKQYLYIRLWGIPAVLLTLTLSGYFLGVGKPKRVMSLVLVTNLINLILDLVLVIGLGMAVRGAAIASVVAEYTALAVGLRYLTTGNDKPQLHFTLDKQQLLTPLKQLLLLNKDLFLRSLVLQLTLLFITFQATKLGSVYLATNAVLMQFFVLIALGLDALAHGAEVYIARAKGYNSTYNVSRYAKQAMLLSLITSVFYSALFFAFGEQIVSLITNISDVRDVAREHMWLMVLLPFIAHWCFVFDGIFIGLTRGKDMRNSMLFSTIALFLPAWLLLKPYAYLGLWLAFLIFLAARGVSLGYLFRRYLQSAHREH